MHSSDIYCLKPNTGVLYKPYSRNFETCENTMGVQLKNDGDNWKSELESFNYDLDEVDPYISQINHFIDVINKKVDPITNASDAKRTLKVALSILESAKLNSIVKI